MQKDDSPDLDGKWTDVIVVKHNSVNNTILW